MTVQFSSKLQQFLFKSKHMNTVTVRNRPTRGGLASLRGTRLEAVKGPSAATLTNAHAPICVRILV